MTHRYCKGETLVLGPNICWYMHLTYLSYLLINRLTFLRTQTEGSESPELTCAIATKLNSEDKQMHKTIKKAICS